MSHTTRGHRFNRSLIWLGLGLAAMLATTRLEAAEIRAPFTNSVGMAFVAVAGTPVWFSRYETRVSDYRAFVKATGREWSSPEFEQTDDHPAVKGSWNDAMAFCAWLTAKEQKEGSLPEGCRYRLPTSAEWSAAAGLPPRKDGSAGYSTVMNPTPEYPWGTQWPPPPGSGNYGQELQVDRFVYTAPVGSFPSNRLELFDLGGNVWEWCEDIFNNSTDYRVVRGGSFRMHTPSELQSSYVTGNLSGLQLDGYGFRAVLDPGQRAAELERRTGAAAGAAAGPESKTPPPRKDPSGDTPKAPPK
jgi:formylglycine-generating enzyme required for sulfatase activity